MASGESSSVADTATMIPAMSLQNEGTEMLCTVTRTQYDTKQGRNPCRDDGSVVTPRPAGTGTCRYGTPEHQTLNRKGGEHEEYTANSMAWFSMFGRAPMRPAACGGELRKRRPPVSVISCNPRPKQGVEDTYGSGGVRRSS